MTSARRIGFAWALLSMAAVAWEARGDAAGILQVTFQWTDRGGGVHPLAHTWTNGVEDDSPFGSEPAGADYTSNSGINLFVGSDSGPFQTETEFRGEVQGYIGALGSTYGQIQTGAGVVYSHRWPLTGTIDVTDPPGNRDVSFTVDNTNFAGTALGVMQAVNFMRDYTVGKGLAFPYLTVNYDATAGGTSYYPDAATIKVQTNGWASWDAIMHEVGHHVAFNNNLGAGIPGAHFFGQENIVAADPGPGARRAYNEGVATFLGQLAVNDGNLSSVIPGLPAKDYDSNYDTFNTPLNSPVQNDVTNIAHRVSLENLRPIVGAAGQNLGEGDELSVMRVLWDVYDSNIDDYSFGADAANWGATGALGLMNGARTFKDFWDHLTAAAIADPTKVSLPANATQYQALGRLGLILQEYNIGHLPYDIGMVGATPTLRFGEQDNDNATKHRFVILDENLQRIIDERIVDDTAGMDEWRWDVTNPLAAGRYYFAALGNSAMDMGAAPATDAAWYWSSLKSFTVVAVPEASTTLLTLAGVSFVAAFRLFPRARATRRDSAKVPFSH